MNEISIGKPLAQCQEYDKSSNNVYILFLLLLLKTGKRQELLTLYVRKMYFPHDEIIKILGMECYLNEFEQREPDHCSPMKEENCIFIISLKF